LLQPGTAKVVDLLLTTEGVPSTTYDSGSVRAHEYTADDKRRHVLIGTFAPSDANVTTRANHNIVTVKVVYPNVNPVHVAAYAYNKSQQQLAKKFKAFGEFNQSSTPTASMMSVAQAMEYGTDPFVTALKELVGAEPWTVETDLTFDTPVVDDIGTMKRGRVTIDENEHTCFYYCDYIFATSVKKEYGFDDDLE
jgi:hypothetical protein